MYTQVIMNIEDYREFCLSLGDAEEKIPFTAFHNAESEMLAFYVGGHIFALFNLNDFGTITLKCQPDTIEELKLSSHIVTKPMSMSAKNLKYWVGIDACVADDETLKSLTLNAYHHVKEQYAKKGGGS